MKATIILLAASIAGTALATDAKIDKVPTDSLGLTKDFLNSVLIDLDSPGISLQPASVDRYAHALAYGNFNGDLWGDLAIGIPGSDFLTVVNSSGAVLVLYGTANGLSTSGHSILTQTTAANSDGIEAFDRFGWSLASGDFDGDGIDDLAVGTPYEDVTYNPNEPIFTTRAEAGAINIFLGSPGGFGTNAASTYFHQGNGTNLLNEIISPDDHFGWSMVSADFDNDGFDDLVVSAPDEDAGASVDSGQINIYFGGDPVTGISADNHQVFAQNSFGFEGDVESGDQFGYSLATGGFNNVSGFPDLAVGVPGETVGAIPNAGAVQLIYGSASGLSSNGNEIWSQEGTIAGAVESGDNFGFAIAAGNFDGDNFDDLVVGVPDENLSGAGGIDAGFINVIYGSPGGLTATGNQSFSENTAGITGLGSRDGDRLGHTLTTGDLDLDGFDDIVIGMPFDTAIFQANPDGAVRIIYGSASGATVTGNDVELGQAPNSRFGFSVVVGDFGAGPEMAVGIPRATSVGGQIEAGSLEIFRVSEPLNPPIFTATGPFAIDENSADSTQVGDVDSVNGNGGATDVGVAYSITGGNTGGAFSIIVSGVLSVANSSALDFELQPSFDLEITATDAQNLQSQATVTVDLNNLNDMAPVFTPVAPIDVDESVPNGTILGFILANDGDGGGDGIGISYAIIAGNDSGIFSIGAAGGLLSVGNSAPLDASTVPTWNLTIEADDGLFQSTLVVVINVTDGLFMDGFESGL